MKVLIVDDEPLHGEMLESLVTEWGYTPVLCKDGIEGLTALREPEPPQLVILDWMMPRLTGDDFCRRVRAEFGRHPLHIILLTGKRISERDMVIALKAGADDYLVKPCDPTELRTRVESGERAVNRQNEAMRNLVEPGAARTHSIGEVLLCRYCTRFRAASGNWQAGLRIAGEFAQSRILSAICDDCIEKQLTQITVDSL